MKTRTLIRLALSALCLLTANFAQATTWYVATTGNDSNIGTTAAQPYKTIQKGVKSASTGDTVSVADGTYSGVGNYNIDFMGFDMTVQSASNNPANCIIDCGQQGRAFYLHRNETASSAIVGLTIRNGKITGNGGGIYANNTTSLPIVTNCVFTNNTASRGGGMEGGAAVNCTFTGNSAQTGGGMEGSAATNCTFTNNSATNGYGGGIYSSTNGAATTCTFTGNSATNYGGGMYKGTATNCFFTNNSADGGGGLGSGTALNCVFTGNSVTNYGGGIYGGTAENCTFISNAANFGGGTYYTSLCFCTVVNNTAQGSGGGVYLSGYTAANCIIWGNNAGTSNPGISGTGTVTYSDVQRGYTGLGNISSDPVFVNQSGGDLHLTGASPCINGGTTFVPAGFTFPTADLDGTPRTVGSAPDMGAYEYAVSPSRLVWQNNVSGDVTYWQMNGPQYVNYGYLATGVPLVWKIVAYADITGNGSPAIIWQNTSTGDVTYWQINGTQYVNYGYLAHNVPLVWKVAAVSDITGDGKPDIIWQNQVTGDVTYWQMNGTQYVNYGYLAYGVPLVWKVVAAADVTGDAKADLIWQNSATGDVTYWQMNGTQYVNYGYLAHSVPLEWKVSAVSDITGDGKNDLIWQSQVSGDVTYWQLNGTQYVGWGSLAQAVPLAWKVVGLK